MSNLQIVTATPTLSAALKLASGVADKKSQMPLLGCVLLRAASNKLTLSATDLALSLTAELPADVRSPGAIALNAEAMRKFVSSVSADTVSIATDGTWATVSAGKSRYKIAGHSDRDFPKMPDVPAGQEVDAVALFEMLSRASYAVSRDESSRPAQCGVCIDVDGDRVAMLSTDGKYLARLERTTPFPCPANGRVTVIAKGAAAIASLLGDTERCTVSFDAKRMHVVSGDTVISAALIDHEYIRIENAIPKKHKASAVLGRDALTAAIQRVAPLTDEGNGMRVTSIDGGIQLSSRDKNGQEMVVELDAEVSGEIRARALPKYILECVGHTTGDVVTMEFGKPEEDPIIFKDSDDSGYTGLVMQMRWDS